MKPTIVTVTFDTWSSYTSRLLASFFHYIQPTEYHQWIMVDSTSDDYEKIMEALPSFPAEHREKFMLLRKENVVDLPQYNRIIPNLETEKVICISTDVRIWAITIKYISALLDFFDMVGEPGPFLSREGADKEVGGVWHWVPKLLVDRGIDFDYTPHVQTHCFGIRKSAFVDAGGFWVPEDGNYADKGNLISGEVSFGTRMLNSGHTLGLCTLPAFHYGNSYKTREELDNFDKKRGWLVPFKREV